MHQEAIKNYTNENEMVELHIKNLTSVAQGTFGVVYRALITVKENDTSLAESLYAIKKIALHNNDQPRELTILQTIDHVNVIKMHFFYYSDEKSHRYLNMVLQFIQFNLYEVYTNFIRNQNSIPSFFTKVIIYQLLRGLAYLHYKDVCHRDIKPLNILVESPVHVVKISDFGSAKYLASNEINTTKICTIYYRAPELALDTKSYGNEIDVWSCGCVLAELMLGRPLFPAQNVAQLVVAISKTIGSPSDADYMEINEAFLKYPRPTLPKRNLENIFVGDSDYSLVQLLSKMLVWSPSKRIKAQEALLTDTFKVFLKDVATYKIQGPVYLPQFVNFTPEEYSICPQFVVLKDIYDETIKHSDNC